MSDARAKARRSKFKDSRQNSSSLRDKSWYHKKDKKPYVLRGRNPAEDGWWREWHSFGKYKTIKRAKTALNAYSKKYPKLEFKVLLNKKEITIT